MSNPLTAAEHDIPAAAALRPLRDYLVVRVEERQVSRTLLVVKEERPNIGTVVAVGPGKRDKRGRLRPLDVKVGDRVRWGEFMYPRVWHGGVLHCMIQEADVAGVEENATEDGLEPVNAAA